ncbi:hypothetical protein [Aquimarina aggregata]|uniref:hypothetical protein n=2 Tax=Aquimarina aggregata TaxID=1642818 RepID=UPI002491489E|nr:hypothetical protein [Aquimarina aggregata]
MMKKLTNWFLLILTLVLGFTSCEENENFEQCPEIKINVENETGSAVYRFAAQLDEVKDLRFTWSVDGEDVDTGNLNDLAGQILDYRFEAGKHTICVKVASEDCPIQVCTDIEVERDETNPCPDLFFESRQYERPSQYKFIADFRGVNEINYGWFINDEFVEDSSPNEDNYLIWDFKEPGRYEVCIKAETPDCANGTSYCKVIEVAEVNQACPEVSFSKEMEAGSVNTYVFEANVEGVDEVSELMWYVNNDLIENSTDQQNGNRTLLYQFAPGEYKICLKVTTPDCEEGVTYCKEIRIDGDCPNIEFSRDGDSLYERSGEQRDYVWTLNGQVIDDQEVILDNGREFSLRNLQAGTYKICLGIETPECPNGVEFCKEIVIEENDTTKCPELLFTRNGNTMVADFDSVKDVEVYEWLINDEVVETESNLNGNNRDNELSLEGYNPGTYVVCMIAETPDCPNGVKYCKEIIIE